jgi:zinc/manganese transport system substrate-binding protein
VLTPALLIATLAAVAALAGCGGASPGESSSAGAGRIEVVAAENFWGSIAMQLAGDKATVKSIIVNPATDPHSYEPTAGDARALAGARLAIVNGIGYDTWASRLLQANPVAGRLVMNVGSILKLGQGENPHQWYAPASVQKVIAQITADYDRLDPRDAPYFAARRKLFETSGLRTYDRLLGEIRARYAGTPVGYSESIFRPLGEALGLKLLTPYSFAKAIAEGTDVTAQDKETVDTQAENRQIAVWVLNSQNITPDIQRVNQIASQSGIPIATVTETLSPATASFQDWQVAELRGLLKALRRAKAG